MKLILSDYSEGRGAAAEVDAFLSNGTSRLPVAGGFVKRVSSSHVHHNYLVADQARLHAAIRHSHEEDARRLRLSSNHICHRLVNISHLKRPFIIESSSYKLYPTIDVPPSSCRFMIRYPMSSNFAE